MYNSLQISIIEDDATMADMITDFLETKFPGAQLTTYKSGEEALNGIFRKPSLIILDYHLDGSNPMAMNGLQVLAKLKERHPDVEVVFLSAQESTEIAANTMKYGAYDYILKNQHAFNRLEVVMRNIMGQNVLKKNAGTQRFFNYLLATMVIALLIGIIYTRMTQ
jgi:DNA-binding NtrC family response regulator